MSDQKGLLLAMMEPPAEATEEFHAWYDTEHIPQRQAVKGFVTALRFVCTEGWPRYVAIYDLDSADVLDGAEYRAIGGENLSPWSKRIGLKVSGQWRFGGTQIHPGEGVTNGKGAANYLLLMRWRDAPAAWRTNVVAGLRQNFERAPGVMQVRAFATGDGARADFVGLVESRLPFDRAAIALDAFTDAAEGLDLINVYAPYWRRGDA